MNRVAARSFVGLLVLFALVGGCGVKKQEVKADRLMLPAFPMTRVEALRRLEGISRDLRGIDNVKARTKVQAIVGGVRTAKMSTSPELDGVLVLERPDRIRLKTSAAMGFVDVFDLVSDGGKYRFLIPEKKQLWEGLENGPPVGAISEDPMINTFITLRPRKVLEAVLIDVLPLLKNDETQVFFENVAVREDRKTYYVAYFTDGTGRDRRIVEKLWFDLSTAAQPLVRRQTFKEGGEVDADIRYFEWKVVESAGISIPSDIQVEFPDREIVLNLNLNAGSTAFNTRLSANAFALEPGNAVTKALPTK